ncbi:hypothetical protein HNP86_001570 [Methanococcus maripaludis]|uniref:Uncharacterized protein n=1 Tax=Methanococcus maripaludis TaxID=39152 RepID=A0A7J9NVS2_METMI|nr:hypothetical protein [Methanococcus maripaludis]MBA2851417.1 hypothetical protein [Methanococcus maripaludis]
MGTEGKNQKNRWDKLIDWSIGWAINTGLFMFSYLPLFLIFSAIYMTETCSGIEMPFINCTGTIPQTITVTNQSIPLTIGLVFIIPVIFTVIFWIIFWYSARNTSPKEYVIVDLENRTKDALDYFVPYMIAFMGFNLCKFTNILAFVLFLGIMRSVAISTDLVFINPVLTSFGYKMYRASIKKRANNSSTAKPYSDVLIITKRNLKIDDKLKLKHIYGNNIFKEEV